mmetsp:Transcript_12755/g.23166  ORF Transcript_12755/g.23166 Transcript_12755/m.23166 type:complete len:357 (+) Transcript_12755:83-1153(+)|eukprot:CAMPEP_0197533346 /NCGR_PEP_ID=MMETSP1318-20131121/43217_1 /TAXON_ID=552666 /ORGANISM="Partenskyella glossopodia, Strain RCC365" /LENGTH=356 /DNA_ID=CAMNT_0043090227 /DNA_START=32 /DNA_END=1102 /DNA_ORIENTATION=-
MPSPSSVACPFLERPKDTSSKASFITCSEVLNMMKGRHLILLDIRPADEFKASKLMKAMNIPVSKEFIANPPDINTVTRGIRGMGKFQFKNRVRAGKTTVIMSADGKTGPEEPATAMANVVSDASSLCILEGGFEHFRQKFAFAVGKLTLPWYPTALLKDKLLLGSEDDAKHKEHLEQMGITHILNVSSDVKNYYPDEFVYHKIDLPDEPGSNLKGHFQDAFEFLKSADKCLIHCHQGVSRSCTVTLAYLMHEKHWTLKDSYDFVKANRSEVHPNPGFWRQLGAFESEVFGSSTLDMCVDLEKEDQEYKAKNGGGEIGESESGKEETTTSSQSLTLNVNAQDSGVANDRCEVCVII